MFPCTSLFIMANSVYKIPIVPVPVNAAPKKLRFLVIKLFLIKDMNAGVQLTGHYQQTVIKNYIFY